MWIATAKSRFSKNWKNQEFTWPQLLERLKETTRTYETVHEYAKMPKTKQSDIKDIGGFVAGKLKDGRRLDANVISRSCLTLDIDFAPEGFWNTYTMLFEYSSCVYSTHKHTSKSPRLRLIVPLSREVSADEYGAVSRKLAEEIGIDYFDDTTYQASRLMYWPSTSKDGEYVFHSQKGPLLDPDVYLAKYDDWKDVTFWPTSSRVEEVKARGAERQGDPFAKDGLIGAFCRTYSIEDAIDAFLSDVYGACTTPHRYTYLKGSSSAGLVIYEDKFAYSNHSTDPASMQLCNAFDLVRIHKFGEMDQECKPDTPVNRKPSWSAMMDFIGKDPSVAKTLAMEKRQEAQADFEEFIVDDGEWMKDLKTTKRGQIEATIDNIYIILKNDPNLKGLGGIDQFSQKIIKSGTLPWWKYDVNKASWTDEDDASLRHYLEKCYDISNVGKTNDALTHIHLENSFHPIKDYLDPLTWDGENRLDTLFIDYLGAEDTEYVRQVTRKAFTAAVARIYSPGCKFDYITVLNGPQGLGKSHILSLMGGRWFNDTISTVSGKEAYEALHGSWIIEMAELTATRKSEIEAVKQFISKREDRYRKAYDRRVSDNPRQCVFFGTTNDDEFLRDYTGNRRFWPVDVGVHPKQKNLFIDFDAYEISQVWAEAKYRYSQKEPLYLDGEVLEFSVNMQKDHTYRSPYAGIIQEYLDRLLPDDWSSMDLYERRSYLEGETDKKGVHQRTKVCALEVWCEALGKPKTDMSNLNAKEINSILSSLDGWEKSKTPIKFDQQYGSQRGYKRTTK